MNYMNAVMPMLVIGSLLLVVFLIAIAALFYVFYALGLYTMAKRRGVENAWIAWIPIAWFYIFGKLADDYAARYLQKRTNYALLLPILYAVAFVLMIIAQFSVFPGYYMYAYAPAAAVFTVITAAVSIVFLVFYFISMFRIYNWHTPSSVALLVLSIIFGFIVPFVMFAIRNGDNPLLANAPVPASANDGQNGPPPSGDGPNYV